ncbi:MAG: polysaccharide deacetylase family protein [Acidimicrobiia bacterium]|nr:polysaccharide deacetylase family protein [Acidimicrobiia bacterium]
MERIAVTGVVPDTTTRLQWAAVLVALMTVAASNATGTSAAPGDSPPETIALVSTTMPIPPTTSTTTTTTTVAPYQRIGIDPDLAYPTIEPAIGIVPVDLQPVDPHVRVTPLPGTLALTFDDGPDPKWTPMILDILKEHGATATFFVLGWKIDAYPDLARRIVDEGHSLQSHAYRHHNLTNRSDGEVLRLIDDTARAIFDATGTTPVCLRPPGGITNRRLVANAASRDHVVILWTGEGNSGDYVHGSSSQVLSRARHWRAGYITLMHDTWGALYRVSLDAMLDDIESRGIGFSTVCVVTDPLGAPPAQ